MPTYEYRCDACNHNFDEFQSFSEKPLKKCPKCGKSKLRRVFGTGAAVIFKGSGFYQTDYRSESYKQGAKAEESQSGGGKSDGGKTDSAKTESKGDGKGTTASADTAGKADGGSGKSGGKKSKSKD